MRQYSNTNDLIKWAIVFCDLALLNAIFIIFLSSNWEIVPFAMCARARSVILIANFCMLISQNFYSSLIYIRRARPEQVLRRVTKLVSLFVIILYIILKFLNNEYTTWQFFVVFTAVLYISIILERFALRWLIKHYRRMGRNQRHIMFIGNDPILLEVYKELVSDASTGYRITGYYADKEIDNAPEKLKRLGTINDLNKVMESNEVLLNTDDAYCSLSYEDVNEISKVIRYCDNNVIHFFFVPLIRQSLRMKLKMERLGDIPIFTNHEEPLTILSNRAIKRSFDIIFSLIILIVLLPFIPIIAIIIKCQSKGPVFFSQKRTGHNGNEFVCYKFRSMNISDDADLKQATLDDPRKFAFGRFMRATNIDELPQFFNVLIGNMSIVGPRPHMLHHTEQYSQLIDKYMVRHFAKPGITGWAQVNGFRGETKELWQMEERVKKDIWYIENWSFWLDVRIIYMTIRDIILGNNENAY